MDFLKNGKILYVSSVDLSIGTGPGVNELEFVTALCSLLGDRATALIPTPKHENDLPKENCVFSWRLARGEMKNFIPHTISQIRKGKKLIRNGGYDLVVFRLGSLPLSQYVLAKFATKKKIPYVIKTSGPKLFDAFTNKKGFINRIFDRIHRKTLGYLIGNAMLCDCVSEIHRSGLAALFPDNQIRIIDNAVNTDRFTMNDRTEARKRMGVDPDCRVVGYAGNFPYSRGGLQMVEAAKALEEQFGNMHFVVLGAGTGFEELKNRAKELFVDHLFTFAGVVPFADVSGWVSTFDVGVSFLEPKSAGASEQKIRQYLACGKPVVCSHGSSSFVAEEGIGLVCDYNDIDTIVKNISYYLNLPEEEYAAVSEKCRQYAVDRLSVKSSTLTRLTLWSEEYPC